MKMNEYQLSAIETAQYSFRFKVIYPALGLSNEAGEVVGKVKKVLRDADGNFDNDEFKKAIAMELGDVLWYIATLAYDLGIPLEDIAKMNVDKLKSRKERGVIGGSGDNR